MKSRIPLNSAIALCMVAGALSNRGIAQSPPGHTGATAPAAPLLSSSQLQDLVGRFALYPDDLIALILPASTTPLEIVKAQRFLTKYAADKNLKPDATLSQPVLTLLTYPDVINFMGDDLEWTEALGHAFTDQQQDVLDAIQIFRRKAQSAGNLKSDDKQTIVVNEQTVQIVPAQPEVIYVPQYQPAAVIVVQSAPVITYVPTAYPIYYRPGAAIAFAATVGYVAGANNAYGLNWYGGGVYRAPYAAHYNHIQDERMDYANNAREDWQDYGKANREDWQNHANNSQNQRQQSASSNQSSRQQTSSSNQSQRQEAVAGGQQQRSANQTQRQSSAADAQSSSQQNQAQRQSSAQSRQPSGAQSWQGSAQTRQTSGSGQSASANRTASSSGQRQSAASSPQFGARQSSRPASGGAYGGASSGARAQSQSARGERSMSGASRSGGGGSGRSRR